MADIVLKERTPLWVITHQADFEADTDAEQPPLLELAKPIKATRGVKAGNKVERYRFRLLDDDGIVYARGTAHTPEWRDGFEPLDWAAGMWGCTELQYWHAGKGGGWRTL